MYNSEFARLRSRMNNLFNEFDAAMGFGGGAHPFWGGASRPGFGGGFGGGARGLFDDPFFDDDFRLLTAPPASSAAAPNPNPNPTSNSSTSSPAPATTTTTTTTTTSGAEPHNKPGSNLTTDSKHSTASGNASGSGNTSHEMAVASPPHGLGLGLGVGVWGGAPSAPWLKQMKPISVDVMEKAQEYTISADLPGLSKSDVKLSVENGVLTITGERKQSSETSSDSKDAKTGAPHFRRIERVFGQVSRSFKLPPNVDVAKVSAAHDNGVLTITLPKLASAPAATTNIQIK